MGPAVGRWRIAATATAQPVYIRTKVPTSSATADPSRLLESTWPPRRPPGWPAAPPGMAGPTGPPRPPPADPSRLLESTWLPYRPLDCPPSSSFCWTRRGLRVAGPDVPPDPAPPPQRTC